MPGRYSNSPQIDGELHKISECLAFIPEVGFQAIVKAIAELKEENEILRRDNNYLTADNLLLREEFDVVQEHLHYLGEAARTLNGDAAALRTDVDKLLVKPKAKRVVAKKGAKAVNDAAKDKLQKVV